MSGEAERASIHSETTLGHVHLVTGDLPRLLEFYGDVVGFREAGRRGKATVALSSDGRYPFAFLLTALPGARRPPRSTGLYHSAILFPTRRHLGQAFLRLRDRGVPIDGMSDHLVSEAIYLRDPDGNGIELYADRDRAQWPRRDGQLVMSTEPLDLESLLAEAGGEGQAWTGMPEGTRIGHVHLRVSDLGRAEAFYHGIVGFDVTLRRYQGALFMSAGGYHHHLGVNVWSGVGLTPPPPGSTGLHSFSIRLPARQELARIVRCAEAQRVPVEGAVDHGLYRAVLLRDSDGIGVELAVDAERGDARPKPWQEAPLDVSVFLRA